MADHGLLKPSGMWWSRDDLPATTSGLRLVRVLGGDRLRAYTVMDCKDGAAGIAHTLNQCFVTDSAVDEDGSYGLVDLLDGYEIVGEIGIAEASAFQRLRRKIGCKVESTDGDPVPAELAGVGT